MSWLYTIVFAGLILSSDSDRPVYSYQDPEKKVSAHLTAGKDETEKFEQTYPINANGRVSVSNVNGSIVIEAWDRNEVRLEATKVANTKEALADVQIEVSSRPDNLSVEANYDEWKYNNARGPKTHERLEVHFRLWAPRTAQLNEIETVNGPVTVGNFVSFTKVSAVNGNVTATNLRGTANLSTVNGEVNANFDLLEKGSRVNLDTVNGRVNLVVPSDVNATIKADSLNGEISNDLGLPVRKGQYIGRDLYGRVGSGEVQIKLSSVNGGLSINRKKDGRTPHPATNLLPQKKADDEEWDEDTDELVVSNAARIDREVARAVRQSQQQAAATARAAGRAVQRVPPPPMKKAAEGPKIKLSDIEKIKIDEAKIKEKMTEGLLAQKEAFERFAMVDFRPMIEQKRNSFAVKGPPRVTIDAKGCGVKVRGWDKQEVQYVVTEFTGRIDQRPLSITETNTQSDVKLTVSTSYHAPRFSRMLSDTDRVRVEVFVPKKSNLKIVTDGEIRLEGISGDVELNGGDGAINVRDVDGKLRLAAADGQVRVIGFKGELTSQTVDGDVFLEGDFECLTAKATEGTIFVTVPGTANASVVSNTEIEVEGLDITRENQRAWRLGKGGVKYNFTLTGGRLVIRNSDLINGY